jgi:hypothetical protein
MGLHNFTVKYAHMQGICSALLSSEVAVILPRRVEWSIHILLFAGRWYPGNGSVKNQLWSKNKQSAISKTKPAVSCKNIKMKDLTIAAKRALNNSL